MKSKDLAKTVREDVVRMAFLSKGSHVGSALSIVDILAVLYSDIINVNKNNYEEVNRDRFILSKGHAGSALYATLARLGFFDSSLLDYHYANGSKLSGHVSHKGLPGIEVSTGSLGHGISMATGFALNAKLSCQDYRVYVIIGDGECDEGSVWEACAFAVHHKLDNLTVIVDNNKIQAMGKCDDVLKMSPYEEKFKSFGLDVISVDGHNHEELKAAFLKKTSGAPKCIVANTIKGYGVSFMENNLTWHYRNPSEEDYNNALIEIRGEK